MRIVKQPEERKQEILENAIRVFARKGYERTSISDIAKEMNIDISEIDTVIISHGHKDHGGALKEFMALNSKAKIYVRREAFEPHYIKVFNIPINVGLEAELLKRNQIVVTDEKTVIDEELFLFSDVRPDTYFSSSNNAGL